MALSPKWKEDEDEAIDITKETEEPFWKVVGNPSRRGSLSVRTLDGSNNSPPETSQQLSPQPQQQPQDYRRGSLSSSEKQWGSFGGFQWNGPSIFDEEISATPKAPLPPNTPDLLYDPTAILSVPMLPNVSLEPSYRPQRSFSFSMGQDPTFFGYDDYGNSDMYARSALAPTLEEDEEQHDNFSSFDDAYLRARSQSSSAAFGMQPATSSFWGNGGGIRPTNMLGNNTMRRSSLGFVPFMPASNNTPPSSSIQQKSKDMLSQRRMSQPLISDYSFPNGGPTNSSFLVGVPATNISLQQQQTQLSERLENIHIHKSTSSSIINNSQQQLLQESIAPSLSTPQHQELPTSVTAATTTANANIGKGMLLQRLPPHIPLYMVEFKSGRTDFYYVSDPSLSLQVGDLVIVEADRGKDLGKIATDVLTVDQVSLLQQQQHNVKSNTIDDENNNDDSNRKTTSNESHVKKIYRQASTDEVNMLLMKDQDEQRALSVCLQKIKNRKLPMEVVDAEFQWDRRKLTFYFIAERRIDFRELVRELFKIYKTRIWMCAVNPSTSGRTVPSC